MKAVLLNNKKTKDLLNKEIFEEMFSLLFVSKTLHSTVYLNPV